MLHKYRNIITNLLCKVNELSGAPLEKRLIALEIQLELLQRIIIAEKLIRKLKRFHKNLQIQLTNKSNTKANATSIKDKRERIGERIDNQTLLIWIYKNIGDSIAFIYGDRWDLKQFVFKSDAGFITDKSGLSLEVDILKSSYQMGATVLMNDLTNTMRHGDITLFRPDLWPEGGSPTLFIEAKSGNGGNKERAKRQASSIKLQKKLRREAG